MKRMLASLVVLVPAAAPPADTREQIDSGLASLVDLLREHLGDNLRLETHAVCPVRSGCRGQVAYHLSMAARGGGRVRPPATPFAALAPSAN